MIHNPKARQLAKAAIAALEDMLKAEGVQLGPRDLSSLVIEALGEKSQTLIVTLATPSGSAGTLTQSVKQLLEKKTGRPVEILEKKDPSLIGGVVISYGDQRIDYSVRSSLTDALSTLSIS